MNMGIRLRIFGVIVWFTASAAMAQTQADAWTFTVSPYLWLPNVNGTSKYSIPPGTGGSPDVEYGPNDYLSNLQLALFLSGEARQGPWFIYTDAIYLDFASQKSRVKDVDFGGALVSLGLNVNTESSLKGLAWTLGGGYSVVHTPRATFDVLAGFRYLGVDLSSDWQLSAAVNGPGAGQTFPASGSVGQSTDLWDAIVGVRGKLNLGEGPWFVPYYLDIGSGSSTLTWQALLGVAYSFKWGDLVLAYRHLNYDQNGDELLQDFSFSGPLFGAMFHF